MTGEGGGDAGGDAPAGDAPAAEATPVAAAASTPATPEPELPAEPEPEAPYVAAAKARKTIPVWVMPVLLFLPFWAIYYVGYLERPPVTDGLAFEGNEVYATCSGCHGVGGGGGSGRQLSGGEVALTFPAYEEGDAYDGLAGMIAWVANGSTATAALEGSGIYGDPDREGGPQVIGAVLGNMSGFGAQLDVEELAAVVYHERSQFGELAPEIVEEEFEVLEEFVHVAEEEGVEHVDGMTVAEVHEMLEEARAKLAE